MFGRATKVRRSQSRRPARRGAEKPPKRCRTTVFDRLEERCCPSTVDIWLGGTGNYSNPANWSLRVVPNNGNLVGGQPATFTVEIAGGQHDNSVVTMDTSATIDNLAIDATNLLSIANGRSITIVGGSGTGMITNKGTIALDSTGDNTSLHISGNVSLTGGGTVTLSSSAGSLIDAAAANSALTNVDNTIKGSGQIGGGLLSFDNQGTIVAGASSNVTLNARFVTNEGTIQVGGGGMIAVTGPGGYTQNSGLTSVAADGSFAITFDDNQTGGATTVDGTLSATTTNIGGTLSGKGTINGHVSVSGTGTVSPGDASAPGPLNISGNYTQASGGVLQIALGGSTPGVGGFSVLNVTGTATLATGSNLDVSVVGGFMPTNNETFQFLNGQSLTGSFAQSGLQQGSATFTVGYNPAFAVLTAQVPVAPSATTLAASGVTNVAATLNGSVNPQRSATTVTFVYGTDPTLMSGTTTTTGQAIGSGTSAMAVSAALTGLQPATTYYDEVVATSANGTTDGAILSFFTPGPSTATTEAATAVTSTTATLNASVNPEGSATTVMFVYGTDPTLTTGTTTTAAQAIGGGTSAVAVTAALTGLAPGTTYYEQVVATSAEGTTHGAIVSFVAPAQPVATTVESTAGTPQSATAGRAFAPLVATVLDQNGNPLGGVSVMFAAPSTGAGGTFAGGLATATVTTSADGVATAPTFVANGVAGGYVVTASVAGLSTPASFHLNNTAAATATVQFASAQFSASATDGSATIVLTRTGNFSAGVTVVISSPGGPGVAALQETVMVGPDVTSLPVSIPIQNDGKPNQPDVVIPLALSSPSAGAALGAVTSASLVVHDNSPLPAPVTVSLQLVPVNVATGGRRAVRTTAKTGLQLTFSGAINGAGNVAAYHVFAGKTKKGVTTFKKPVALTSVQYSASALTATLVPRRKLNLTQPEQLQVTGALLTDAFGRPLDGKHNGQPGSDFVANFSKKGVQIERAGSAP